MAPYRIPQQPAMRGRRSRAGGRVTAALLLLVIGSAWGAEGAAAAMGFPAPGSSHQATLERFFFWTLIAATILTLVVLVGIVWFARPRHAARADLLDWRMSRSARGILMTGFVAVPALVIGGLGVASYAILMDHEEMPEPDMVLDVRAVQFAWHTTYPGGEETLNEIQVREGDVVLLRLSSADVIHSIYIPAMGVKQDVMPGHEATTWFEATRPGTYEARCAEFCGVGHPEMTLTVRVVPPDASVPIGTS